MGKTRYLACSLVILLTVGCAHMQPYEFQAIDEIRPGPGLFSGKDGEFVIIRR